MSTEKSAMLRIEEASTVMAKQRKISKTANKLADLHRESFSLLGSAVRLRQEISDEIASINDPVDPSNPSTGPQDEMRASLTAWGQQMFHLMDAVCGCFGPDEEVREVVGDMPGD